MITELVFTHTDKYTLTVNDVDNNGNSQVSTASMYVCEFDNGGEQSWNGDFPINEPLIAPTSEIVQRLIDIYGTSLIGRKLVIDLEDTSGNILRLV